ncbi:MAG TPA: hypothetical protein PL033_19775 [Candidatus Brocadiia bacterium]|nr:hypothetical protein [Candidatus Brocadiia bacterium]
MKYCPKCNLEFLEVDKSGQGRQGVCPFCRTELQDKPDDGAEKPPAVSQECLDELPTIEIIAKGGENDHVEMIEEVVALDDQPTADHVLSPEEEEEILQLEDRPTDEDPTKTITPVPAADADFRRVTVIRDKEKPEESGARQVGPGREEKAEGVREQKGGFLEKASGAFKLALAGEESGGNSGSDSGLKSRTPAPGYARSGASAQGACPACGQLNPRDLKKCRFCGHVAGASVEVSAFKGEIASVRKRWTALKRAFAFTEAQFLLGLAVFLSLLAFLSVRFDYDAGGLLRPWEAATGFIAAAACLIAAMIAIRRGERMAYIYRRSYQSGYLAATLAVFALGGALHIGRDPYALRLEGRAIPIIIMACAAIMAACYTGALRGISWAHRLTGFTGMFAGIVSLSGAMAGLTRFLGYPGSRAEAPIMAAMAFFVIGGVLCSPIRGAIARRRLGGRADSPFNLFGNRAGATMTIFAVASLGGVAVVSFIMGGYLCVLTCSSRAGLEQLMAAGMTVIAAAFGMFTLRGGAAAWQKKGALSQDLDALPAALFKVLTWLFGFTAFMSVVPPTSSLFFWLEGWTETGVFAGTLTVMAMLSLSASRGERWAGIAMAIPLTAMLQWAVLIAGRNPPIPPTAGDTVALGDLAWALAVIQAGTALIAITPPLLVGAMVATGAWRLALKRYGVEEDQIARRRMHQLNALGGAAAGLPFTFGLLGLVNSSVKVAVFVLTGRAWDYLLAWIFGPAGVAPEMPLRTPEAASAFLLMSGAMFWLLQLTAARGNCSARRLTISIWAVVFGIGIWGLVTWAPRLIVAEMSAANSGVATGVARFAQGADDLLLIVLVNAAFAPFIILGVWLISAWRACSLPAELDGEVRAGLLGLSRETANVNGAARLGAWFAIGLIVMGAMSVPVSGAGLGIAAQAREWFMRATGDACAAVASVCLDRPGLTWMIYCAALGFGGTAIIHFAALGGNRPALGWTCLVWSIVLILLIWDFVFGAASLIYEADGGRIFAGFALLACFAFAYGIACGWRSFTGYRSVWRLRWAESDANKRFMSGVANTRAAIMVGLAISLIGLAMCAGLVMVLNPVSRPFVDGLMETCMAAWVILLDTAAMIMAAKPLAHLTAPSVTAIGVVFLLIHSGAYWNSARSNLAACIIWTLAAMPAGFAIGYLFARKSGLLARALGPVPTATVALLTVIILTAGAVAFLRRARKTRIAS